MRRLIIIILCSVVFLSQVKAAALDEYQRNLDNYRNLATTYDIKNKEFVQYGTYTAEERLVQAAQAMLIARAEVWLSYWSYSKEMISMSSTLQASTRDQLISFYDQERDWLLTHKEVLATLNRRDTLLEEAKKLNVKDISYDSMASQGLMLLYAGKMQNLTERLLKVNQGLQDRVNQQTFSQDIKTMKLRGLQVNKDRLEGVRTRLAEAEQAHAKNLTTNKQTLKQIKDELAPIHSELGQLMQVLKELTEGVEW